jgi:hypothetical protein
MANRAAVPNPALRALEKVVGEWKTIGSHPMTPGLELHGHVTFEWIEGGAFLRMQNETDDKRFPNGIAIIGSDDGDGRIYMLYFDEREVSRRYEVEVTDSGWRWWRDDPKLAQRFCVTVEDGGNKMVSKGEMRRDGGDWEGDLDLSYERC